MALSVYIKLQQKRLENKSLRKSFGLFITSETKQYELTNIQCYTQAIRDAKWYRRKKNNLAHLLVTEQDIFMNT